MRSMILFSTIKKGILWCDCHGLCWSLSYVHSFSRKYSLFSWFWLRIVHYYPILQ